MVERSKDLICLSLFIFALKLEAMDLIWGVQLSLLSNMTPRLDELR